MTEEKICPICHGKKKACDYCDGSGLARDEPLYSANVAEEVRLWAVRNDPGNRVRSIARARLGNQSLPLHPTELVWLREGLQGGQIPFMSSIQEWDALVTMLLGLVARERVECVRQAWEKNQ